MQALKSRELDVPELLVPPTWSQPFMKIAIMSDIHGFSLALDRVLADIQSEPGIDRIVVAGDLCEGGPDPAGVLERLSGLDAIVLQGNTDRDIGNRERLSDAAQFTMDQIGPDGLSYLRELPFSHRISPPGIDDASQDLLVVHANPFDQDRHIRPDAGQHELRELIGDTNAAVIAFGHLHIAYIRELSDVTLLDVSAVGNPKDEDLRSKWGLVEWLEESRTWNVSLRYVDYPLAETEEQIRASGMPNPEKQIRKLRKASYA
jgi:predicted phosphodiesterase